MKSIEQEILWPEIHHLNVVLLFRSRSLLSKTLKSLNLAKALVDLRSTSNRRITA